MGWTAPPVFFWVSMNCPILVWNIRGAVGAKGKRYIRELVRLYNPSIVVLLETHSQFSTVEKFWDGLGFRSIAIEEARGFSGGIWILLKDSTMQYVVFDSMSQAASIKLGNAGGEWIFTAIYASPTPTTRAGLWDYLVHLRRKIQHPWLVVGDFNEVLSETEVRGGEFVANRAGLFRDCIDQCELIDIGAIGSKFTWQRSLHGMPTIWKRLDRAMADWR